MPTHQLHVALYLLFTLVVCAASEQTLIGRWVREGALGVYDLNSDNSVVSLTPVIDSWKVAQYTLNISSNIVSLTIPGQPRLVGDISTQNTVISFRNISTTWHKYGTQNNQCNSASRKPEMKSSPTKISSSSSSIDSTQTLDHKKKVRILNNSSIVPQDIKKVHLVFSMHFDFGFTDYAWCVIEQYFWTVFPGIVDTSLALPDFKYLTHPWLLYLFFNCERLQSQILPPLGIEFVCPVKEMQDGLANAIKRGQVTWSAYPFDGFNEVLGSTLFNYAFDFAEWLSNEFGVPKVTTMVQIDVPGVFQAQLNTLVQRDIQGLYMGQNGAELWAGAIPLLPHNLFRWKSVNQNNTVVVMTHKLGYGGIDFEDAIIDPVSLEALVMQCRHENSLPYAPQDILGYIAQVQKQFPNAVVNISTIDNFLGQLLPHQEQLPLYEKDIGNTWVRSIGSDPKKAQTLLRLRRGFEACVQSGECPHNSTDTLDQILFTMTGCEHNWGFPVNPIDPESVSLSDQEKRDMLQGSFEWAKTHKLSMYQSIVDDEARSQSVNVANSNSISKELSVYQCGNITVGFGANGAITSFTDGKIVVADSSHPLAFLEYTAHNVRGAMGEPDTVGGDPVQQFLNFTAVPTLQYTAVGPANNDICSFSSISHLYQSNETTTPTIVTITVVVNSSSIATSSIQVDFSQIQLSFSRYQTWSQFVNVGDAMCIQFNPLVPNNNGSVDWLVTALGVSYNPNNFFSNGTTHYHIADNVQANDFFTLHSFDAPLVMFGNSSFMSWFGDFNKVLDFSTGVWVNLFNTWNMYLNVLWPWKEEDTSISYRFTLNVKTD